MDSRIYIRMIDSTNLMDIIFIVILFTLPFCSAQIDCTIKEVLPIVFQTVAPLCLVSVSILSLINNSINNQKFGLSLKELLALRRYRLISINYWEIAVLSIVLVLFQLIFFLCNFYVSLLISIFLSIFVIIFLFTATLHALFNDEFMQQVARDYYLHLADIRNWNDAERDYLNGRLASLHDYSMTLYRNGNVQAFLRIQHFISHLLLISEGLVPEDE